MKYFVYSLILVILSSCNDNNCNVLEIDESIESIKYNFKSPIHNPFKLDGIIILKFNDTVRINGEFFGPMDTIWQYPPTDFYSNNTEITFLYERYKATSVDIRCKYCFY